MLVFCHIGVLAALEVRQLLGIFDIAEQLWRERRNTRKFELFTFGEGVANFEVTSIVQTHNIAWIRKVDNRLLLRHKCCRRGELHLLATCGSEEGKPHKHWENTKTVLQKGHMNPLMPLEEGNIIP